MNKQKKKMPKSVQEECADLCNHWVDVFMSDPESHYKDQKVVIGTVKLWSTLKLFFVKGYTRGLQDGAHHPTLSKSLPRY